MKIVAWRLAGDLLKDEIVMTVLIEDVKTTKAGVKFISDHPEEFRNDDLLEVINPGRPFRVKETKQISIAWEGDED